MNCFTWQQQEGTITFCPDSPAPPPPPSPALYYTSLTWCRIIIKPLQVAYVRRQADLRRSPLLTLLKELSQQVFCSVLHVLWRINQRRSKCIQRKFRSVLAYAQSDQDQIVSQSDQDQVGPHSAQDSIVSVWSGAGCITVWSGLGCISSGRLYHSLIRARLYHSLGRTWLYHSLIRTGCIAVWSGLGCISRVVS